LHQEAAEEILSHRRTRARGEKALIAERKAEIQALQDNIADEYSSTLGLLLGMTTQAAQDVERQRLARARLEVLRWHLNGVNSAYKDLLNQEEKISNEISWLEDWILEYH
jgi:chromosome segregation ATPase